MIFFIDFFSFFSQNRCVFALNFENLQSSSSKYSKFINHDPILYFHFEENQLVHGEDPRPSPPNKILKANLQAYLKNLQVILHKILTSIQHFDYPLKSVKKPETEMILTLIVFITIQEVSELNIESQFYLFAQS